MGCNNKNEHGVFIRPMQKAVAIRPLKQINKENVHQLKVSLDI